MKFQTNKSTRPSKSPRSNCIQGSQKQTTLGQKSVNEGWTPRNIDIPTPMSQLNSSSYFNFSSAVSSPKTARSLPKKIKVEERPTKVLKLNVKKVKPERSGESQTARSRNIPLILELKSENLQKISKSRRKSYQPESFIFREGLGGERKGDNKSQTHKGTYYEHFKLSLKNKIEEKEEYKFQSLIPMAWKNDCYYMIKNQRKIQKHQLDAKDEKKFTPLHIAVKCGYLEFVRILLKLGADPNVQNIEGNTPLHLAFMDKNLEMARLLLRYNAQPGILNSYNKSSIYYIDRQRLIIDFPELKHIPFSRETIGNCTIEKRVPSIITSNLKEYSPLYQTDTPSRVYESKVSYFNKIFKTFKPAG